MRHVLIVDDYQDSATSLQRLLQEWGHEARVATDGAMALTMADKFHPDVVLLDVAMPGMDGWEVAKRLRQLGQQEPIIAISGYCTQEDVRRSLEAGCNYHLPKPIELDELRRILETL